MLEKTIKVLQKNVNNFPKIQDRKLRPKSVVDNSDGYGPGPGKSKKSF